MNQAVYSLLSVASFTQYNAFKGLPYWCLFVDCVAFFFFFFLAFYGTPAACGVPRLVVKLELQLLAYTIATAMPDLICIFALHHSLPQLRILNPSNSHPHGS